MSYYRYNQIFMTSTVDWDSRIGRRLRLRDLHIFFAVVQSGSMAKAATHLRVTQPAVSKAIGALEAVLGVRLFDRSTQGVEPTMYGEALIKCGSAVFDELKQGIKTIEFLADPTSGDVRIGCLTSIAATILPVVIQRFAQKYPRVVVHQDDVNFLAEQLSGLRNRKHDLTVARLMRPLTDDEGDLNVEVLFNDRMVLTAGTHSRWARRRKIDLAELVDEPWILSAPDTWNYARLTEAFQARGLPMPNAKVVTLSTQLKACLLANGPYIVPFQNSSLQLIDADRYAITILPVDLPDRQAPIALITLKNRTLTPVVERFIEYVREVAKSIAGRPGDRTAHRRNPNVS
jgi:DNA-binding transcriptional LysR family regulator